MSDATLPPKTHNNPPVSVPNEADLLDDLKTRYPDVEKRMDELEAAAKTFPERITDDENAGKLQDLLRQMSVAKAQWKSTRGVEKRPWDGLAKVVMNFFGSKEEKIDELVAKLKPVHTRYLEDKAEEERIRREDAARKQREEADKAAKAAAEAEERRLAAVKAEEEANARAEQARKDAEAAETRRLEALERARLAKEAEDRAERERKDRDRAEREVNATNIRELKALLKTADKLAAKAEEAPDRVADVEAAELDELINAGGKIGTVASKLAASLLLDDEEKETLSQTRTRLAAWRNARDAGLQVVENKKQAAAREKAEKARAAEDARLAADAKRRRGEEDARLKAATEAREKAEAEAAKAREDAKNAKAEVRDARAEAREAFDDQRDAAKDHRQLSGQAEKNEKRADRMETKLEEASDAELSRTRGSGSVGSLSGRWDFTVNNREAIPLERLRGYLHPDAVDAAITKYMRDNRTTQGVPPLDGVEFYWNPDGRIV